MSDDIKAAAERLRKWNESGCDGAGLVRLYGEFDDMGAALHKDRAMLADAYLALGERQEDRWTHQRASDGALSMFTFETPQAAANYFHSEKDGRIVRVSTFKEGEGA